MLFFLQIVGTIYQSKLNYSGIARATMCIWSGNSANFKAPIFIMSCVLMLGRSSPQHNSFVFRLGLVQTPNFSWAELNANELKQKISLIYIEFDKFSGIKANKKLEQRLSPSFQTISRLMSWHLLNRNTSTASYLQERLTLERKSCHRYH